jgi:hypothetical protein
VKPPKKTKLTREFWEYDYELRRLMEERTADLRKLINERIAARKKKTD